jgi:hypothetical protein
MWCFAAASLGYHLAPVERLAFEAIAVERAQLAIQS